MTIPYETLEVLTPTTPMRQLMAKKLVSVRHDRAHTLEIVNDPDRNRRLSRQKSSAIFQWLTSCVQLSEEFKGRVRTAYQDDPKWSTLPTHTRVLSLHTNNPDKTPGDDSLSQCDVTAIVPITRLKAFEPT